MNTFLIVSVSFHVRSLSVKDFFICIMIFIFFIIAVFFFNKIFFLIRSSYMLLTAFCPSFKLTSILCIIVTSFLQYSEAHYQGEEYIKVGTPFLVMIKLMLIKD